MTNVGIFEEAKQKKTIKKLKARVKDLLAINKEHQMMNGKLRSELEIERKNHTLTREGEVEALKQQLHTDREKHEKEIEELNGSWEKYNETRNKLKKRNTIQRMEKENTNE